MSYEYHYKYLCTYIDKNPQLFRSTPLWVEHQIYCSGKDALGSAHMFVLAYTCTYRFLRIYDKFILFTYWTDKNTISIFLFLK
jgi:hypothetical protein